jgi:hypothetical protein
MGAPGRVELPTNGLGNRCSIQLSYGAAATQPHYFTPIYEFGLVGRIRFYCYIAVTKRLSSGLNGDAPCPTRLH